MDYNYPLFFEAKDLEDKEKNKIRRHFMKRRDSGGGECGGIEKVGGRLYKICFKEEEDQRRVLQRKNHTITLPSGELCLTVSRTIPGPISGSLPMPSTQPPSQSSAKSSTSSSANCLEKTFPLDIFLLYYLRDCPKAFSLLQKQLSCIGFTVELNFVKEVAVVRGDADKGLGGAFSGVADKWELQVDRVLSSFQESFPSYHVMEPKKVKAILQDGGFAEESIRVYTEPGYTIVVGEAGAVSEKMTNLERSLPKTAEVPIDEKHYKLIEEEFTREMWTNWPNVRIVQRNNVLILHGLDTEIVLGLAKYKELLKKIQQKQVQFSAELLNFFTSSGAIAKYQHRFQQSLRNPVSLDASKSDLVLSSLSSEALEEAAASLKRDLSVASVHLQGNAAVPPDLDRVKEMVIKKKINANVLEKRIDVRFIPGPNSIKVQLVGYSEHVNQLKEVLHDYQLNHVSVQEVLNLPSAEMVDSFDKILNMIDLKQAEVSIKPSHFPYPCVLVSGPRLSVQKTQLDLNAALSRLISDMLVLDGPGARQYFSAEGKKSKDFIEKSNQVLIQELPDPEMEKPGPSSLPAIICPTIKEKSNSDGNRNTPLSNISLKIKLGNLENEQVNVLIAPMLKKELMSTRIGKSLSRKGGLRMNMKFSSAVNMSYLSAGEVLEVVAPPSVGCFKVFFIECLPWDGLGGQSVQALSNGLKQCLDLCVQQGYTSVAIPVIGLGKVFKYPLREAVLVLTEKIKQFALTAASSTLVTIHIVIKPDETNSEEIYQEVHRQLSQNMNQGGQVSSDLDDLSIIVGTRVQLQLIFGDITNERTEAVVNSTDFVSFNYTDVSKDILAVAGPEVEAELKSAKVMKGDVYVTQPGRFPCQALLHVNAEKDAALVELLLGNIVQYCEAFGWTSVAIPAICAGTGGLSPGAVAGAVLRGLRNATSIPLCSLVKVRLVLNKIRVFLAFKEEATQMFSTAVIQRVVPPPPLHLPEPQPAPPASIDLNTLCSRASNQNSVFIFTGLSQNNISNAIKNMRELYQSQCSTQTIKKEDLARLAQGDLFTLKQQVEFLGLQVQCNQGDWFVSGLTSEVNKVFHLVSSFIQGMLIREMRMREEEDLYGRVAWCILGNNGNWERLPKPANHQLENKETAGGIKDAQGQQWDVDLPKKEVTKKFSTHKAILKRLENLPDFTFPLYWDSMASGDMLKVVSLLPSSAEYQKVKEAFQLTCFQTVLKIERVQNIHLRRSYEAQKKHISDKNKQSGGANEKLLFHGTTQENCTSISNMGFNRRFSGQNATAYGQGTYFAINASYSAYPTYSKPTTDGSQLMFLARVLTGLYTQGHKNMRLPPSRNPQQQYDRFDSVVDKTDNPSMFVVFHDNQAYPDYLITFR